MKSKSDSLSPRMKERVFIYSPIAQLVEQVTVNHWVGGSSPSRGANENNGVFPTLGGTFNSIVPGSPPK